MDGKASVVMIAIFGFIIALIIYLPDDRPKEPWMNKDSWMMKECDFGRAIYYYRNRGGVAIVENAPECANRNR